MSSKNLRLTITLDKGTKELADNFAQTKGSNLSKFIRYLIADYSTGIKVISKDLFTQRSFQRENVSLRVSKSDYTKLVNLSSSYGFTYSNYIEMLINSYFLSQGFSEISRSPTVVSLYSNGSYKDLVSNYYDNYEQLTITDKFLLASAFERLGNIDTAFQLIKEFRGLTKINSIVSIDMSLLYVQLLIFQGDLIRAANSLKSLESSFGSFSSRQKSQYYYLTAELFRARDDLNSAYINYLNAIDILNSEDYTLELAQLYLRMASLMVYLWNLPHSMIYLSQSHKYFSNSLNNYYWGQYYNTEGIVYQMTGKFDEAHTSFTNSMVHARKNNSTKEQTYNLENFARLSMVKGDNNALKHYLNLAREVESRFRAVNNFNRTRVFSLYYSASIGIDDSINQLQSLTAKNESKMKPSIQLYVLNVSMYLYGKNREKKKGEWNLKKFSKDQINNPSLAHASEYTLTNKRIGSLI